MLHLLTDTLLNSVLITGIVIIMMMMIESFDIESHGRLFSRVRGSSFRQVILASLLGSIPGCIGGFATVSLYNRRLLGFGALTAMMIASSGDEAFVMLAMMPDRALWIFAILFAVAVISGIAVDAIWPQGIHRSVHCPECSNASDTPERDGNNMTTVSGESGSRYMNCSHSEDSLSHTGHDPHGDKGSIHCHKSCSGGTGSCHTDTGQRSLIWQRLVLTAATAVFAVALAAGWLAHDHAVPEDGHLRINLLSEWWMNLIFALLSIIMLVILCFRSDRFIRETLWRHIIMKHMPNIFAWTFGVIFLIGLVSGYVDISRWVSGNPSLMILLAVAIGIIPESGPHLIFVTLYAGGLVPLPVLLASCISQDGHSTLPLLAEDKRSFFYAKLINCLIALLAGFGALLLT